MKTRLLFILSIISVALYGQPQPCGPENAMTSTCATACVVCDIDGFTGVNNLTAQGQGFDNFCTTQYNNMQYIAFIAGSVNLTVQVDVSNCQGGLSSLEVGFFYSEDCENFEAITICDTDIESGESQTFTNNQPLVIGQYYYLIMDGSGGANCNWTFNVLSGTTEVLPLTTSGDLSFPDDMCPGVDYDFSTTVETGAAAFEWTVNGITQPGNDPTAVINFPVEGSFEVCVTASNVCDMAPPSCETILVRIPESLFITEDLCEGECINYNNTDFCITGLFVETIPLLNGCDSSIIIDLTVHPIEESFIDLWICSDEVFLIGTTPYNMTGSYQQTILSDAMCDSIVNLELLIIECEIEGSTVATSVICNGTATGTLSFSIDQGTPPLTYTYRNIADSSINGMGTTNILTDNLITGLPAGDYQIYIQDDFGNDVVLLETVTEPSVLASGIELSSYGGFNVSCAMTDGGLGNDGTAIAEITGGQQPYQYLWSDGQMTMQAVGLMPITYQLTVTDALGCTLVVETTLTSPSQIMAAFNFENPDCTGFDTGEISLESLGGGIPGYSFALDNGGFTDQILYEDLVEGNYEVFVMDSNGCVVSVMGSIVAPDIPIVDAGEDLTISLGDSIQLSAEVITDQIAEIVWTDSSTLSCGDCLDPYATTVNDTEYYIAITSADGCTVIDSLLINVDKRRRVYVPNIFTPNGDGLNEFLLVYAGPEADRVEEFLVFDRWGELIYSATDFKPGDERFAWDGRFKNKELNPGIFSWMAKVHFIDDEVIVYSGDVSLVR